MNVINQVFPEVMCQQKRLIKAPFSQARVVQGNEDYGIILFQPVVVLKVKRKKPAEHRRKVFLPIKLRSHIQSRIIPM